MTQRVTAVIAMLALVLAAAACDRRIDVDFNVAFERAEYEEAEALLERGADIDARFTPESGHSNHGSASGVFGCPLCPQ